MRSLVLLLTFLTGISFSYAQISISIKPEKVIQGEPVLISIQGTSTVSGIKKFMLGTETLKPFVYKNIPRALYGVDLVKKPGSYPITLTLKDGAQITKDLIVLPRQKIEAPLGIPESLGGNTATSVSTLVNTLALENAQLASLKSGTSAFWKVPFQYPVRNVHITDDYGYSRLTGASTITHKGTDFRAPTGTKIYAMNRGVVRSVKTFRNYGKTVVVDHGLGVMTMYMHLSKIQVAEGQLVTPGQLVGLSGKTGYAESPHLHLTVRINNISIDPIKFLELFK